MKNNDDKAPAFKKDEFHCPHCEVYAHQDWYSIWYGDEYLDTTNRVRLDDSNRVRLDTSHSAISNCGHCNKVSIWINEKMVYPLTATAPLAHEDMPEEAKTIYNEARLVGSHSPRAAAALLRVALEKLTEFLGETEGSLNSRIKKLKEKELPEKVIQSLDIVRITANEGGAHAGQIDLTGKDNQAIVNKLFWLVNFIVEKTITDPKKIENMYNDLPEEKKQGVEDRDS